MTNKRPPITIVLFSAIEIFIGLFTLLVVSFSIILDFNTKPLNILIFVYVTSILSFFLGIGILRLNKQAYELLIFLCIVIILSKVLIFLNIIRLNGALETTFPPNIKNAISVIYHSLFLLYLKSKTTKSLFKKFNL
jgi:hypothetical protein